MIKGLFIKSLIFGMLGLTGISSTAPNIFTTSGKATVKQLNNVQRKEAVQLPEASELPLDVFSIDLLNATRTPKAESFEFAFNSVVMETYFDVAKQGCVYVAINDPTFEGKPDDYEDKSTVAERPHFTGTVFKIDVPSGASNFNIDIPEKFNYRKKFILDITNISQGACTNFAGVTNINIPNSIVSADEGAFVNCLDSVNINFEASSLPADFDASWTDKGTISYSKEFPAASRSFSFAVGCTKTFGEGKDLSVGYKYSLGGTDYNYPLIVSYETKNSVSGVISEHVIELPIYNENGKYDIIGHSTGSNKLIRTIDINTIENEVIDPESFVFYNIYPIIRSDLSQAGSEFIPDVSESYKAAAKKSFTDYIDVLDIINFKFVSISSFAGYTCLIMNVDEVPTAFETCNPKYYQNYKDRIDSGEYVVRYGFYNLVNSKYDITYVGSNNELKEVSIKVGTPISAFSFKKEKGNRTGFIIKNSDIGPDFTAKSLRSFDLVGCSLAVYLYNTKNKTKLNTTEYNKRFGPISVLPDRTTAPHVQPTGIYSILVGVISVIVYVAIILAVFFTLREKYKNDEFRRIKPKRYFKSAGLGLVGVFVAVMFTWFTILRTTLFKNAVTVYNPVDVFIIIFAILTVIAAIYFIKFLIERIKAAKQHRQVVKLKLNDDVKEDGTN